MADITKQDIKEVVIEVIEPFSKATQREFTKIDTQCEKNEKAHAEIRQALKTNEETHEVIIKADEKAHTEIKNELVDMKRASSELFTKLDKFFGHFEKHEQEHHMISEQMRRFEDRLEKLEPKKSR